MASFQDPKSRRPWLLPGLLGVLVFFAGVVSNLIVDNLGTTFQPYRRWLWVVAVIALVLSLWFVLLAVLSKPRVGFHRTPRLFGATMRLIVGTVILSLASVLAFLQTPKPDPLQSVSWFTSLNWWRYPLEWNASNRLPRLGASLYAIQPLPNSNTIWAAGNAGLVIKSEDGGKTWTKKGIATEQLNPTPTPSSVSTPELSPQPTPSSNPSPTVSPSPSPLPSQPLPLQENGKLLALNFANENQGEVLSDLGRRYSTTDGGNSWTPGLFNKFLDVDRDPDAFAGSLPLRSIQPLRYKSPDNPGFVVVTNTKHISVMFANDFGFSVATIGSPRLSSTATVSPEEERLMANRAKDINGVYTDPLSTIWLLASKGRLYRTLDFQDWTILTPVDVDLYGAFFIDRDRGWAVGNNGSILKTEDSGDNWTKQPSGTTVQLNAISFLPDGQHGWAAGHQGVILSTTDGGNTWVHATLENTASVGSYWRFPAPWYFAILLAVGFLVLRKPKLPEQPPEESVADVLLSDRPLEEAKGDVLAFNNVAYGLSRFLRNENTIPPLTIAITGEWGTGKSSLMNLLRADLRSYRFRPVWFNAWHHQKEEQMFSSLLESIKYQAVPRWWTSSGLLFRLRLLQIRGARHWLPIALLLFVIYVLGIYYYYTGHRILLSLKVPSTSAELIAFLPALAGVITIVGAIWQGMSAFGIKPSNVLAGMSRGVRIPGLEQTSFRQRFASQFNDVTRALGARSLLIFIDDLDRCRPDNVLETLEAVNFLTTSGECFVIIGMARGYVERCVGRAFNEVAQEMVDEVEGPDANADAVAKQKRIEFARQYLDKLINIEVPVPLAKQSQSLALLVSSTRAAEPAQPANRWQKLKLSLVTFLVQRWQPIAMLLVVGILIVLGHNLARDLAGRTTESNRQAVNPAPSLLPSPVPSPSPQPSLTVSTRPGNENPSSQPTPAATPGPSPVPTPSPVDTERAELIAGGRDRFSQSVLPFLGLLTVIGLGSAMMKRPGLIVKDSPKFIAALEIWHPLIFGRVATPRATKRFMNFVRYLAMRQRRQSETEPPLTRFLQRFIGEQPGENIAGDGRDAESNLKQIPDEALVALAALQHLNPAFLVEGPRPVSTVSEVWPLTLSSGPLKELLDKVMKEHEAKFGNWSTVAQYRAQFLEMTSHVKVR